MSGKSFQWINNQNKASNYFKRNSIQERVITLPNFHNPFELETYASGYAMEAVLMQGGRLIFYHSKVFHGVFLVEMLLNTERGSESILIFFII